MEWGLGEGRSGGWERGEQMRVGGYVSGSGIGTKKGLNKMKGCIDRIGDGMEG